MAQRRMFSPHVVGSDVFLDMPLSSQALYFHLGMHSDDDGFVSPNKIMRMVGASPDELKLLVAKQFLIPFDTGVVVITHWPTNNLIRKDWYRETVFVNEKKRLSVGTNKHYQLLVNDSLPKPTTIRQRRLGKDSIGKDSNTDTGAVPAPPVEVKSEVLQEVPELIKAFEVINPVCKQFYNNTNQRKACQFLIDHYGYERVKGVIEKTLPKSNNIAYFPTITTPTQLMHEWPKLEAAILKHRSKGAEKGKEIVGLPDKFKKKLGL